MGEKIQIPVTSIDTGVPVPDDARAFYPLKELKVNESFLFPLSKRSSVQSRVSRIKADTAKEFIVKKIDEKHARVWRTK